MQPLFSKSILPFYKKHTTFLKRGRMVVFELLLNRCWKQCIHPKIDTVVFKKHWTFLKKRLTFPKKKRKNHSWEQTSKGGDDRSRMGCDPYKEYVFQ